MTLLLSLCAINVIGLIVQLLEALIKDAAPTNVTQSQPTASKAVQSDICTREDSSSPRGFRKTSVGMLKTLTKP